MKKLILLNDYLEATDEWDDSIYTYVIVDEEEFVSLANDLENAIQKDDAINDSFDGNLYDKLLKIIESHHAYVVEPLEIRY